MVTPHPVAVNKNKGFPMHVFIFPVSERNGMLFNSKSNLDVIITVERISAGWVGSQKRFLATSKEVRKMELSSPMPLIKKKIQILREGLPHRHKEKTFACWVLKYITGLLWSQTTCKQVAEIISIWCL